VTSSQLSPVEVIALANEKLTEAANSYKRSRLLQILTFAASVGAIFASGNYAYLAALAALTAQGAAWGMRIRASGQQALGDEGRMRGLLIDALGPTSEHIDLTNLIHRAAPRSGERAASPPDPNYFASQAPHGFRRLRDHLQENAFWGTCQYETAAAQYVKYLIGFIILAIITTLLAIPYAPRAQSLILARILVTALTFGAALTQSNEILAWRSAKSKIETVDRRLEALTRLSETDLKSSRTEALFAVFGDYCVATAISPPIPRAIYQRDRDRLNRLWEDRRISRS
jgi:hypothetical protein